MITLRRQNRFNTRDPDELGRQLAAFEEAVDRGFKDLQAATFPRGETVTVEAGQTVTALIGGYYICDAAAGDITLILQTPRPGDANTHVTVEKVGLGGNVFVKTVGTTLINNAESITLTTAAGYTIKCNGQHYRREF